MVKLALIGKGIAHSKSPEIYRKLFGSTLRYDLIDVDGEEELPDLRGLKKNYLGINITAPYKRYYLNQVLVSKQALRLNAINCIAFKEDKILGENTDYLAIKEIFFKLKEERKIEEVFILGDGSMSWIGQVFFKDNDIPYSVLSRKLGDKIAIIDFSKYENALIINSCSREFSFKGKISKTSLFWDYNYSFPKHHSYFEQIGQKHLYLDGTEMLSIQAKYSALFFKGQAL